MQSINETVPVVVPVLAENVARYLRDGLPWWFVVQAWSLAVPAIMLWTGFSARMQRWVTKPGRSWFFIVTAYGATYASLIFVANWPLSYYLEFTRPHLYGISQQPIAAWLSGAFREFIIGVILAWSSYWFIYLLIRKSPQRWWLYLALSSLPLLWLQNVQQPRWIEPRAGRYERLADQSIEQGILALAERANVHARVVVDVDAVEGGKLNAFALGASDAKPIVLSRSLVAKLNPSELTALSAHEIGHYARHDGLWTLVVSWLFSTVGWYAAYRVMPVVIARYSARFGFDRPSETASLPLLVLVLGLASVATHPLELAYSRHQEREADRLALELTHANHSFATGLIKAHQDDRDPVDPRPRWITQILLADHPSLGERIDFCNSYRPWER